jgi:hypothetical protein
MSEPSMVEAFTSAIKKANIFEKAIEIKRMLSGFIIITTIMGSTIIINQVYKMQSITIFEKRLSNLEKKIEKLVETNAKLYEIILQNNKLSNKFIENQLLHICKSNNIEIEREEAKTTNINADVVNDDDDLLNECYDIMPCNNSKKVTGLNRIFNWN